MLYEEMNEGMDVGRIFMVVEKKSFIIKVINHCKSQTATIFQFFLAPV